MGKKQTKVVFNAKILKELLPLARPLSFFIPDPHNARSHSPANLKAIANSLKLHGQHRPAVSAPDGRLIIGHGMLEAAKSLGWTHLAVLTTNDTDKEALSRAILDNRTSDLSDFDIPLLKDLLVELDDGLGNLDELTGFTEKELKKLIDWEPPVKDAEPQFDKAEELRKKWGVEIGREWEVNGNQVICGDSRNIEMDRAELILTDPPYDMKAQELRETFGRFADKAVFLCSDNQGYHFCLDGWEYKIGMVWIHKQPRSKKSPYFPINYHTPILIAQKGKEKLGWRRSEPGTGSIIEIEAYENDITGHAKRPALFEEMVRGFSASTVIDPFFGTGSSLVACVNQKKNMTGIEIDPAMLGLALDRFERLGYEIKEMPSNRP